MLTLKTFTFSIKMLINLRRLPIFIFEMITFLII